MDVGPLGGGKGHLSKGKSRLAQRSRLRPSAALRAEAWTFSKPADLCAGGGLLMAGGAPRYACDAALPLRTRLWLALLARVAAHGKLCVLCVVCCVWCLGVPACAGRVAGADSRHTEARAHPNGQETQQAR
jgi:hypothetical protein